MKLVTVCTPTRGGGSRKQTSWCILVQISGEWSGVSTKLGAATGGNTPNLVPTGEAKPSWCYTPLLPKTERTWS